MNKDQGTVLSISDNIALISGCKDIMQGELVEFANHALGMVMNLEKEHIGVMLLSHANDINAGDIATRTKRVAQIGVGDALIGRVVDSLGEPLDDLGPIAYTTFREIEAKAPSVMDRSSVNTPLFTGIKVIDGLIPIGRGQRELILGDRQTGKTTIAIDTIINQKDQNVLCIYVAIGQKNSSVVQLVDVLNKHGAMAYTTIVLASASDLPSKQYLAPYSGVSIGEYWMQQGKDVLIIYDDLSKHAVAYRTISLLLRRSPGREAYPGDVFYLHSRLLERAAKLNAQLKGGSITALPIVETQSGDISAYIPTNIISITDGQIFLQTDLFNQGQRPAVDIGLSVSRVGSSAQYSAMKQVSGSVKIEIANFKELQTFTQFGSDLDFSTKRIIDHGQKLLEVFKQDQHHPLSFIDQIIELFASKNRTFREVELKDIQKYLEDIKIYLNTNHQDLLNEIISNKKISKELEEKLLSAYFQFNNINHK
jgi:F-type H+-transporting ATPase subunit alpha